MSPTEADMNGSPVDRSKRPRLEDEDQGSGAEQSGQDDRHHKRQAVPDPETKAPHFAGSGDSDESADKRGNKAAADATASSRARRKKWEEDAESEDDEVQITVDSDNATKSNIHSSSPEVSAAASTSAAVTAAAPTASSTSAAPPPATSVTAGSAPSAPAETSISLRSLVSTKDAGVIIGRGGKNVSDIRELSAARVTISDIIPGAYERILTVSGSALAVAKAYALVAEKILSEMPPPEDGQEPVLTIRLLVGDNRMGTLIGRGGSVIRSIQEQSHARVNASEEPLPMSTERTVTIAGTTEGVQSAIYQISAILADYPERPGATDSTIRYRPQPQAGVVNMSVRGYNGKAWPSSAASGAGVSGSGVGGPSSVGVPSGMSPYNAAGMMDPMGGMSGMGAANSQYYYAQAQAAAAYASMPPGATGRQSDYGMSGMMGASQAQQIFIPNEMVGCIIGKGGSKINEIRQLSGSHIKIADPHGNTNERLVTITGTPESNQMALYLLYSRLESEKGRMGLQ
ncbi:hypothetical protein BX666DRAFT_1936910 [Dichotomocladium elegans]|nr:hypothetical protein BX666DRAFT_1936910 [Dichotomocladium elegans]